MKSAAARVWLYISILSSRDSTGISCAASSLVDLVPEFRGMVTENNPTSRSAAAAEVMHTDAILHLRILAHLPS